MLSSSKDQFRIRISSAALVCLALTGAGLTAGMPAQAATPPPPACPAGTYQQYTSTSWGAMEPLVIGGRNVCATPLIGPAVGIANTGALAGTWVVPQGVDKLEAIYVGAGGGGGASGHYGITDGYVSGGGGGGGEVKFLSLAVTAGQTMNFSVGAGGEGGQYVESGSKSTDGADGASTFFTIGGTTYTARGGKGGKSGDNGGAGGASGNGNAGGNGVKATSTIGGKSVTLGAGGGGGGAATSATGASATTRADAAGTEHPRRRRWRMLEPTSREFNLLPGGTLRPRKQPVRSKRAVSGHRWWWCHVCDASPRCCYRWQTLY